MALGYANPPRTACAPRASRWKALLAFPAS